MFTWNEKLLNDLKEYSLCLGFRLCEKHTPVYAKPFKEIHAISCHHVTKNLWKPQRPVHLSQCELATVNYINISHKNSSLCGFSLSLRLSLCIYVPSLTLEYPVLWAPTPTTWQGVVLTDTIIIASLLQSLSSVTDAHNKLSADSYVLTEFRLV